MKTSVLRLVVSLAGALIASAQLSARIVNLSTRGEIGTGEQSLGAGFVVSGEAPKTILVRGVGPGLAAFGVSQPAAALKIELYDAAGSVLAQNDGFQTTLDLLTLEFVSARTGAFPLDQLGDSALVAIVPPGSYTVIASASGEDPAAGTALVEVYDADVDDSGSILTNVSGRGMIGEGENTLITGFVLADDAPHTLTLRGVGPDLAQLGIMNPAASMNLLVWGTDGQMVASSRELDTTVQASVQTSPSLSSPGRSDAGDSSTLITLPPGAYTMNVEPSPANTPGKVGMIEVDDGGRVDVPTLPDPAN